MSLKTRLDAHFVACAAAAGAAVVGGVQNADAAIVYSGIVNIAVPANIDGIYLNMVTGGTATTGGGIPGWDFNPYFGPSFFTPSAPAASTGVVGSPAQNLPSGTLISSLSTFNTGVSAGTNFPAGTTGYVGVRLFRESDSTIHFGWVQVKLPQAGVPGLIVDYAYDDTTGAGINAGAIPAPGSVALLALGALGLTGRRRK